MLVNSPDKIYDVLVIGGGINGVGVAADAAGRGLSVLLCEKQDLASATSSASSKLIHGGLRYLEQYAFKLVREALKEREILLKQAPHLVHPIEFILPYKHQMRPPWLLRLGLLCYDWLGGRSSMPRARAIKLGTNLDEDPLNLALKRGFTYYDCKVNDARLVVLNALRAHEKGATICTRTQVINAKQVDGLWQIKLRDSQSHQTQTITAKALINASGPWVDEVNESVLHIPSKYRIKHVQGSHIVVPQLYQGRQGYILQNKDGRVVFVIPYHSQFTMIGTTDTAFEGDPAQATLQPEETKYLLDSINQYFHHPVRPSHVVASWSGVRALLDSGPQTLSGLSREYQLEYIAAPKIAPLINIFGGKITTYRALAEKVVNQLAPHFPNMGPCKTAIEPLPGGDLAEPYEDFCQSLGEAYPFLPTLVVRRYANHYGTRCYRFLQGVRDLNDLGEAFSPHLYEAEVEYLINEEWAMSVEDILERRTQLGLVLAHSQKTTLSHWLTKRNPG